MERRKKKRLKTVRKGNTEETNTNGERNIKIKNAF